MFDHLRARAQANANVRQHAGFEDFSFGIKAGEAAIYASLMDGLLTLSEKEPAGGVAFTMSASPEACAELAKPEPRPGFQTLTTMRRTQNLLVHGDMVAFFRHTLLLEMLFANLSDEGVGAGEVGQPSRLEEVVGRYLHLDIEGKRHRLYFEEAGSDGCQFRHLLNDPEVTENFRVIAFDLEDAHITATFMVLGGHLQRRQHAT